MQQSRLAVLNEETSTRVTASFKKTNWIGFSRKTYSADNLEPAEIVYKAEHNFKCVIILTLKRYVPSGHITFIRPHSSDEASRQKEVSDYRKSAYGGSTLKVETSYLKQNFGGLQKAFQPRKTTSSTEIKIKIAKTQRFTQCLLREVK